MAREGAEAHRPCGCTTTNADTCWLERVRRRILLHGSGIVVISTRKKLQIGIFSRLESGHRQIEISACLQSATGSYDSVSHYTRPDAHTRKPRSGVRGWRLRKLNLNDAPRMCTQRGAEAPLGRAVSSRCAPVGSTRPRQRHTRLGRSCLQSRCAPVGYEEPERMPEVPQTWMVEGPPSQPNPSPGRASVPQGSLPSPKRSILM